jgi:cyclopropane fatty-acyl-phospholipid synthase-like methyltransferase
MSNYDETNVSSIAINHISSIKVEEFLKRNKKVFLICIYRELKREGIITYHELVSEAKCEVDRNRKKKLELVLSGFPEKYRNVANSFDQNINNDDNQISHFLDADGKWIRAEAITTREM